MKKILLVLICLLFSASVLVAQSSNGTRPRRTDGTKAPVGSDQTGPVEDSDDVIKVDTTLVTIPVSVFDQGGRFISGLNKNDFRIFEDGQAPQIEVFATTEEIGR